MRRSAAWKDSPSCRHLATFVRPCGTGGRESHREPLVQTPDLPRRECPPLVAPDVKLDGAAADFAIFHVGWFTRGQTAARLQALATIRAAHRHELLRRHARLSGVRLPDRLEAVEPIDAVRVEARDPPLQPLEFRGLASLPRRVALHPFRRGAPNSHSAPNRT